MTRLEYSESVKALEKAADAIEAAYHDLQGGFVSATANRAYYGCYYSMIAMLYTQNAQAKTHQGVHAKFSELFIKTGIFPIEISGHIAMIFAYRQEADYDLDEDITANEAADLIEKTKSIYSLANVYLKKLTG